MTREQFRPPDHECEHFLLTTVVGSFPQPDWLDRIREMAESDDSVSTTEAVDDACTVAVADLERAGLDVVTDGEMRREGMVEYFTQFVDGYDVGGDGSDWNARMPTATNQVSTAKPWLVDDFTYADTVARGPVKTTITGPFTLASFASLEAYDGVPALAYDFADLISVEVERLVDAGAKYIQIDEPGLGMSPHGDIGHECLTRISDAVPGDVRLGVHVCSGNYRDLVPDLFEFPVDEVDLEFASSDADDPAQIFEGVDLEVDVGFGVVDSQTKDVESVAKIESRIERALAVVPPYRLTVTPDCGMKPLPRDVAAEKVRNMATAARRVERRLDDDLAETVA